MGYRLRFERIRKGIDLSNVTSLFVRIINIDLAEVEVYKYSSSFAV